MKTTLAVKALSAYRKRDIIPYLALRYYLEAPTSRTDYWISNICTRLANNTKKNYINVKHFKETVGDEYIFRDIFYPSPNEALAETFLITEISKVSKMHPENYVYSYMLEDATSKNGVFINYFDGLIRRQKDIALACNSNIGKKLSYSDIKKFYPSISLEDAKSTWEEHTTKNNIDRKYIDLGLVLLENQITASTFFHDNQKLLVGPSFSHVIANLILKDIDIKMHDITGGHYYRYVDDIIMIGDEKEIESWRSILRETLLEKKLELHDKTKDFVISTNEWLSGEHDFSDNLSRDWGYLIGDIKKFLLLNPEKTDSLESEFKENGIRIPVLDYSNSIRNKSYIEKFISNYNFKKWFRRKSKSLSIESILLSTKKCKTSLLRVLDEEDALFNSVESDYEKKRRVPKIRYTAGRLLYLLNKEELNVLLSKTIKYPELYLLNAIAKSLISRDVTQIIQMGLNTTQAAAQLLVADGNEVTFDILKLEDSDPSVVEQSLSILGLYKMNFPNTEFGGNFIKLLSGDENDITEMMSSKNDFIKEFACLHGISHPDHLKVLQSGFDEDEDIVLDLLDQIQPSST